MVGEIFSGIAALAALLTVIYARKTVLEAERARKEASKAHGEEMTREGQLLEATQRAHEQEMAERASAFDRDLWLQRLMQLGRVQEALSATVDATHAEIGRRGLGEPAMVGMSATPLTSAVLRLEGSLVILGRLGGPALADVRKVAGRARQLGTPLQELLSELTGSLDGTRAVAEADDAFRAPFGD